jgi:hypothetical protein
MEVISRQFLSVQKQYELQLLDDYHDPFIQLFVIYSAFNKPMKNDVTGKPKLMSLSNQN